MRFASHLASKILSTILLSLVFAADGTASASDKVQRVVHLTTGILVSDLDKSIDFYTRLVGLKLAYRLPFGAGGGGEVILTPSGRGWDSAVALTYSPDRKDPITHGSAFIKIAVFVPTAAEVARRTQLIEREGYAVALKSSVSNLATSTGKRDYYYSMVTDPDGNMVEFVYFDSKQK